MNIISIFHIKTMNYCIHKLKIKGYWNTELTTSARCFNFFIISLLYKTLSTLCNVDNRAMGKYLNLTKSKIENKSQGYILSISFKEDSWLTPSVVAIYIQCIHCKQELRGKARIDSYLVKLQLVHINRNKKCCL